MGPHPVAYGLFLWPSALPSHPQWQNGDRGTLHRPEPGKIHGEIHGESPLAMEVERLEKSIEKSKGGFSSPKGV